MRRERHTPIDPTLNDVTLKEYLDRRIDDLRISMLDRFRMSDEAVAKAERAMNERLNAMNEFRDALRDQANRMATRLELDKVDEAVQELRRSKANLDGRLIVITGSISLGVTITLWILGRFIK